MFENMLLKVLFWCELFLCFHFQDPKITVRVATDYFQVLWLMIKKVIIIFYLYYTSFRWVNNFMQKEPLPILTINIDAPGEGGAARARAPCLHRAHRCLLCQPGRSDSKQCSKMFASPGPTQAWVQEHILGERVHGTTGIKNVISMYQQIIITIIVILMVII